MFVKLHPVGGTLYDLSQVFLDDFRSAESTQLFAIDATRMTTIVTQGGIRFTFAAFGFQNLQGEDVSGEVQLQIQEMTRKGDMILSNRMTTSEDRLLESAGQLYIAATQGSEPLQLIIPVAVEMPVIAQVSNPLSMRLFVGDLSLKLPATHRKFDWKLVADKALKVRKVARKKYYHFYLTELNWVACSNFHARRVPRTMVSARGVSQVEDFDTQAAFIVFKNTNAVARMYPNGHRFTAFNIPVRQAATVLMIGLRQGGWFYGAHHLQKTSSQLISVKLEPVAELQLLQYLCNL